MNRQQAQEILTLYRGGNIDSGNTETAEALRLVKEDAELARWFEQHQSRQEQLRARFQQITVPAGLKEQIIAERNAASRIQPPRRSPWISLAVAAALALVLGILLLQNPVGAEKEFRAFRNRMLSTANRAYSMDLETTDLNRIREYLAQRNAPSQFSLPNGLKAAQTTGCVLLRWQNRPVSMICFRTGRPLVPGQKSDLFLFVIEKSAFEKISGDSRFEQVNHIATARWTEGEKVFLLATTGDEDALKKYL